MRGRVAIALAACVVAISPAVAADMPPPVMPQAPPVYVPVVAPPPFSWTSLYVGGNGGYGRSSWSDGQGDSFTGKGGLGGGQVGFNVQINQFVVGLEGDLDWTGVNWSQSSSTSFSVFGLTGGASASITNKEQWFSTFAARFGWAFDRVLVYGKVGGAWAEEDWSTSASGTIAGVTVAGSGSTTFDRYGWMVGAGLEYAVTNNITIKAEYNFLDFGTANETLSINAGGTLFTATVPSKLNVNIVKVGVNYLFE